MRKYCLFFTYLLCGFHLNAQVVDLQYPVAKKVDQTDNYFGTKVEDPYRWLENDHSEATKNWVAEENKLAADYFSNIPFRDAIHKRIDELDTYERYSSPFSRGEFTYFFRNMGQQGRLYRQHTVTDEPELVLNIDEFSDDQTTSLQDLHFSKDGSLMAFLISEGGSDLKKILVMDATTKTVLSDTLLHVKFSGIAWCGNEGFFYCKYLQPAGKELTAPTNSQKLYYHKIGTSQLQDRLIFEGSDKGIFKVDMLVANDEKTLLIHTMFNKTGHSLYALELPLKGAINPEPLFTDFEYYFRIVAEENNIFYLETNVDAPNNKLVKMTLDNPKPKAWKEVIAQGPLPVDFTYAGHKFFSHSVKIAFTEVTQYNLAGDIERPVELPGMGTASKFHGRRNDSEIYYTFTSYLYPPTIYKYNIATGVSVPYKKNKLAFSAREYECKMVFYKSKDGTKIPMTITCKKGLQLNGRNPVWLYAYGGFGISTTPFFSDGVVAFMEKGGVFCVPNIRGGGEFGNKWHNGGRRNNKQNSFDDFTAAAEYLIGKQYTNSQLIAASGSSNGGLMVGAVMTQRPDLFKVCVPSVGVMDMLRFQKYTVGDNWTREYGNADVSKEEFEWVYRYSPLHHVQAKICYPATLLITGDHDDRVVPSHTYKFTAALQDAQDCNNPIIVTVENNAGHGFGKPVDMHITETTNKLAFIFWNMGLDYCKL